ncbi:class I SAM-dependent methyltransferase [uncultured Thiohalocapsa sp.]|uniref:class I SAM-dependent methyltransferase n=1 Tax=uncultured Thiohalocapsa sp. TaxID=768990 RepID=UPI0025EAAB1A|nr:class I SAM-dependent methyltransferase [uncultured Thiohalocapsa sp.]
MTDIPTTPFTLHPRWPSLQALLQAHQAAGMRLDLGCGYYKPQGYIGLDNLVGEAAQIINQDNAPDILMDLSAQPLPFADNSVDEVRSSHFLEHSNLDHVLNESWRVLKPGGRLVFTVPYANSAEGMYPGHHIFLTERWFHENLNFQAKFHIERERYDPSQAWRRLPLVVRGLIPFSFARTFLFNACWQMQIVARKRHTEAQPRPVRFAGIKSRLRPWLQRWR